MRLVDVSRTGPGPDAEIAVVPAAEAVLLLGMLGADAADFDLPEPERRALESAVTDDLRERLADLSAGWSKLPLNLLPLAAVTGGGVDDLVHAVEALPAEEVVLHLLGAHPQLGIVPEGPARAALAGERDARTRVLEAATGPDQPSWRAALERLLDLAPDEVVARVVDILGQVDREVFPVVADTALGAIERDAAARRELLEREPTQAAIEQMTNGYRATFEEGTERVLLVPTYVFRPWLAVFDGTPISVIAYPVADEAIGFDPSEPTPQLVRLMKALGDEGRLRLLHRLRRTPLTLTEAAEVLGVAKPTAHHHLSLLRQAGLVSIERHGRESRHSLRDDPAGRAARLLGAYLAE